MQEFLSRPEVQVLVPFVFAFGLALAARKLGAVASSLAAVTGLLLGFVTINGLQFVPLTGARKIMVVAAGFPLLLALLDKLRLKDHSRAIVAALLSLGLVYWLLMTVIPRYDSGQLAGIVGGGGIFCLWLTLVVARQSSDEVMGASSALVLGLGAGASSILGTSALLGTMGLMIGAASGAALLLAVMFRERIPGFVFITTAATVSALVVIAALAFAKLHWLTLPLLALVPLATWWLNNRVETWPKFFRAAVLVITGLLPAAAAVAANYLLIEQSAGGY